jgi:hypothetical protein
MSAWSEVGSEGMDSAIFEFHTAGAYTDRGKPLVRIPHRNTENADSYEQH